MVRAACTTRDDMAIDGMVGEMTAEEALLAVLMVTANTQTIVTAYLLHRRRKRRRLEAPFLRCDDLSTRGGAALGRKRAMVGEMTDAEALLAVQQLTANTRTIASAWLLHHRRRQRQRLEPYLFTRGGAAPGRKHASRVPGNKRKARDAGVVDPAMGDASGGVVCGSETTVTSRHKIKK